ncbi:MAG: hypothetical protein MJA30_12480 [Cytophagales bacterium]|nr:hypothetical protein [Cytophagales bacterium]
MEKFTNNRTEYWNAIKSELLNFSKSQESENLRFSYLEIGELLTHGFSIQQSDEHIRDLRLRVWNAEFDNNRFDKGIYNLNRLAVAQKTIHLSLNDAEKINEALSQNLELTNWNGIVLDGLFCQLEFDSKKLEWNVNEEINDETIKLVEFLRKKAHDK